MKNYLKSKNKLSLEKLQKTLLKIPKGKVVTYKKLAKMMGNEKAVRAVANLCGKNPEPDKYPCYKVIRSDGKIGGYNLGVKEKIKRLENDEVVIESGKVAKKFFWK